ncbi:unnamed protein product [Urochloa humidicola]
MNGAHQAVFFYGVAYGQLLAGGSGGGDEQPNQQWAHEAKKKRGNKKKNKAGKKAEPAAAEADGPYPCPICHRLFEQVKAVHGHQRSHPEREWRGMAPPRPPPPVAADGRHYRYACDRCGAPFETRQALGGHRASHSGKMGCFWLSRNQQPAPAAAPAPAAPAPPVVFAFDLNEPAPQDDEE